MNYKGNILIVEDSLEMNEYLQSILRNSNKYIFNSTTNGNEAIEILKKHNKPQVVLVDLLMPEMDGFEFLEYLRRKPQFKNIYTIVISRLEDDGSTASAYELGCDDFLTKPFRDVDVLFKVKKGIEIYNLRNERDDLERRLMECKNSK